MINGIPICLGTASFGTTVSLEDAFSIMDTYESLGGRIIDTANSYASWAPGGKGGESETVIGKWLRNRNRSDFTIMTKIGSFQINGKSEGLSSNAVHNAVAQCLKRLNTDYIDILLAHHDDFNTPLEESWGAFSELVRSGLVKQVGVSNYQPERMRKLAEIVKGNNLAPVSFVQLQYSDIENVENSDPDWVGHLDDEMKSTLRISLPETKIFVYSPLMNGLFEIRNEEEIPPKYNSPKNLIKIKAIQKQADGIGISPSAYALKSIVEQGITPITTTSKIERLKSNLTLIKIA